MAGRSPEKLVALKKLYMDTAQVTTNPGVDEAHAGKHALYFRRLVARATQSHLPKVVQRPVYKSLTIRNWNTTIKLLALVSA